jgi:RND superfamily putative drug exporter
MFQRLARFCYRRRRIVLAVWVVLLVGLSAFGGALAGAFKNSFEIPGSESQAAFDLLKQTSFADRSGFSGQVVFEAQQGVNDPAVKSAVETLLAKLDSDVADMTVVSPYSPDGARQISTTHPIAYAELNLGDRTSAEFADATEAVRRDVDAVHVDGLRLELGGQLFASPEFGATELIGLVAAVVILLVAFGSLLAMGLPMLTAIFGIGCGIALVNLFANLVEMPDFTTQAASMIGIGVGIDYALFIVTRYRQALREGRDPETAVTIAMDTAGRAVLFAGITVVIALMGMLSMGLRIPRGVAIGCALAVLFTMAAALTMLPAILGFTGRNIDKFHVGRRPRTGEDAGRSFWYRWSRTVQRRPWPAAIFGLVVLVVLALPVFSMRLGFSDTGNRPTSDTTRRAYDLLAEGFGPGFSGPLLLAVETPNGAPDLATLGQLSGTLNQTPGVQFATPPIPNQESTVAIMQVFPTTSPQDEATTALVKHLRDDVIPQATASTQLHVKVGGLTAASEDFASFTSTRLPIFMGAVLALSFLLLMWVFRSLLVPLKAVIMNLLSIGAAYGVIVAVFQYGWGKGLVGVGKEGPIEAWVPMMLFAVVFGLSMDYEVFLLSRIREEYDRTGDNAVAVADGLASTARVITAAAAIMICVFSSFVLNNDYSLKLFGLALAVAVFVDATVVRLILVPATMELLGDRNWWLPHWLDRILPVVHVEATDHLDQELEQLTEQEPAATV